MPDWHTPLRSSQSVLQAAQSAPVLAHLGGLMAQSSLQLKAVLPLIPVPIRKHVQAGPLDDTTWCLLASNAAVATKVKHLIPDLEQHLRLFLGKPLQIRVKITKPL